MEIFKKMSKKQQCFSLILLFMLIGIVLLGVIDRHSKTFALNGTVFKYEKRVDGTWYFYDRSSSPLIVETGSRDTAVKDAEPLILTYNGKTYKRVTDINIPEVRYYEDDVLIETTSIAYAFIYNDFQLNKSISRPHFATSLILGMLQVAAYVESGIHIQYGFFMTLLIIFACLDLVYPEKVWQLRHAFSVKNGQPTDFYLTMTRVGGLLLIVLTYILPFIYLY